MTVKQKVMITSFGGPLSWEFYEDFKRSADLEVMFADSNPLSAAHAFDKNVLCLYNGDDARYTQDLLEKVIDLNIRMIIPGSDEEVFALMGQEERFKQAGCILAVPPVEMLQHFRSKSSMFDHLHSLGVDVPFYRIFRTQEEFAQLLDEIKYGDKPFIIKPNASRGGRGIVVLAERLVNDRDGLPQYDRALCEQMIDGKTEWMLMEFLRGEIFDTDVLSFANGERYIGSRKRMLNIAKPYYGNFFLTPKALLALSHKIHEVLPTRFLVDYDILMTKDGKAVLLEVNPRPSGSTAAYLPFGINMYERLIRSYLSGRHEMIKNEFNGKTVYSLYKMLPI